METMTTTPATVMNNKVEFIKGVQMALESNGAMRTFMNTVRDTLNIDWFSARGIGEKFDKDYRTFFKELYEADSDVYLAKIFKEDEVKTLVAAFVERIEKFTPDFKAKFLSTAKGMVNGNPYFKSIEGYSLVAPTVPGHTVEPVTEIAKPEVIERKKERTSASFNLMLPLDEMVNSAVTDYLENESGLLAHVDKRIKEEAQKLRPTMITIGERPTVQLHGRMHKAFEKALKLAHLEKQIFIAGEAGTGKTTLAEQIAKALGLRFGHISCTAGMSEAHLIGRMDAHGNYLISQFIDLYENGGVFLFDEVDAADSNTMLIINSALANGHVSVPNRIENPTAKRHPDFICICAANTWGFGSNEYAGRNILDAAFLDRFAGSRMNVSYDTELEIEIGKDYPALVEAVWKIRDNVKKYKIRRVVSTRAIVSGVRQMMAGETLSAYLDTFTCGWTAEEIKRAMEGVVK